MSVQVINKIERKHNEHGWRNMMTEKAEKHGEELCGQKTIYAKSELDE